MSSNDRQRVDPAYLHPALRDKVDPILAEVRDKGWPFEVFEAYRTPQRQAYLYAQGRTRDGRIVTKANRWQSYHQYGLAVDLVLKIDRDWSWSSSGKWKNAWTDLHAIARAAGLEPLSWELPHLQVAGLNIADLRQGKYPRGGDQSWADNLEDNIVTWPASDAPPMPASVVERPALDLDDDDPDDGISPLATNALPPVGSANWHNVNDGKEWRYDGDGIYLRAFSNGQAPIRSPGTPTTCRAIWAEFGTIITLMAQKYQIAPEIIIMTIATEAAAYRDDHFTGPKTFRWEGHVWNRDVEPPVQGDYSAGPMQTLASTARWVIAAQQLPYHRFQVAPILPVRPSPAPASHPLYDAATNIEIGTAEIHQRINATGSDPILIAAAFNAGGVYPGTTNAWKLRTYGNHLDRAAQWFGDACAVLKEAGRRP